MDPRKTSYIKAYAAEAIRDGMAPLPAIEAAIEAWTRKEAAERAAEQALDAFLASKEPTP